MNLIIDANSLLKYSYHSKKDLIEQNVGAIFGFFQQIYRIKLDIHLPKITRVYVCWDGKKSRDRRQYLYPKYKSKRKKNKEQDEKILIQKRTIYKLAMLLNYTNLYNDYLEGDDLISIVVDELKNQKNLIITGDSDIQQLINKNTSIWNIGKKKKGIISYKSFIRDNKYSPNKIALIKAICGDDSDDIDGVKGVRIKTLSKKLDITNINIHIATEEFPENKVLIENNLKIIDLINNELVEIEEINYVKDKIATYSRYSFNYEKIKEITKNHNLEQIIQEQYRKRYIKEQSLNTFFKKLFL